jgi:phosphate:Na+ symporter
MGLEALSSEFIHSKHLRCDHEVMHKLSEAVAEFINRLERGVLSKEITEQIAKVLRAEQHLLACADQALEIARTQAGVATVTDEILMNGISHYRAEVVILMKIANPEEAGFTFTECELQLDRVQVAYDDIKAALLQAGAELRVPIPVMIDIIEQNSRIRRMPRQMVKAMHYLSELSMVAEVRSPEAKQALEQKPEEVEEPVESDLKPGSETDYEINSEDKKQDVIAE